MNTVLCPHCKKTVEISEALRHQFNEQQLAEITAKHTKELEEAKKEALEVSSKKLRDQFDLQLRQFKEDAEEKDKRNKELIVQITELTKELRTSKKEKEEVALEMQKKLAAEEEKIRQGAKRKLAENEIALQKKLIKEREEMQEQISKTIQEKSHLEIAEIKKQLDDTKKALEEAQRKASQKSQQLQGEVLELELEQLLQSAFPHDEIEPIGKGVNGADIRHIVKSPKGFVCGTILWESKRTKEWAEKWVSKLKEDLRSEKALCAVIVTIALPKEASSGLGVKDGVWICTYDLALSLATILRKNLLDVGYQKAISANRGTKADMLYTYITSHEFQQQVENIVEAYREMHTQIIKERAAFEKIWKQREGQAQRILLSTANVVGSMQGIAGGAMPQIKGLEIGEENEQQSLLE